MPIRTYTIKTADGKEHQVSKENIDKHGMQAYADAYEGATIRMRDNNKADYYIPLSNYNDAKAQGLHAFAFDHLPPKAQPQAKQQVAQKQPTQQVATTAPGTPMTAAQKAQVLDNTNNLIAQSQSDLSRTMRKIDYAKQNTGLDVKPIKLGENRKIIKQSSFNPQTGKKEESYLTESGNIHNSYVNAVTEQNAIDDFKEQEKQSKLENQLNAAYKERDSITKALQRRMAELDKQGGHGLLRQFADAMSPDLAMHSSPRDYEMDEEYGALMSAARKNNSTIQILEDKKKGRMNNFWSTLGATFSNGYTFTDGLSGVRDNIAILNANKRADKINRKRQRGEMLTNEEDAFDKALLANLVNEEIEGTYGQEYGALARAAKITAGTADVVKDFLLSGGTGIAVTKGAAKGVMNAGAKYLTKKAGESLLKASAKAFGRGLLKATGIGVGSLAGGALITNTTGIGKTAEEMSKQVTGRVGVDQHGNYIFTDSKDLMHAFIEAERSMIGENASEMLGEFIPGSKVLKKGLEKIGLSKISSYLTSIGNKSWAKNYGKLLEAAGWNGLPGEGLEEYAGIAYNSLTGDSEGGIATLGDARTHIDIWLGCAAAGALLGAPNVVALGANTAQYYRYKHATNKAAQQAKSQLPADRWNALQERIDNTENQDLTNLMLEVYTNKELSPKQKKAVFNYTDNLVRMRGYNIGSINNADATRDEKGEKELHKEENIGNAYATGYHATEDELANIKNELELRHRQLTETFKDDPSALQKIEEDPKAFLQGLKESEVGGEKAKVINAYEETRAAYDGMIQRVKDNIDDAITENNTVIEQRTHQDGNIYPATMKLDDRKVYVVGGNVQMNEDGKGIDHEKSSSSVMVRDAETGKVEMVDPSAILSVDTPVNAEEEKATSSEQIKQTYAQEQANKIDGVLEFKAGDTYSILDEDQKQHTIQIIGEAIDEKTKQPNPDMVMASIDGLEPTMLPKEQIQAMNDEENLWRLDQSLKQDEDVENTTPHSAQSYNLNDEITLINEDGKPVRGSITTDQNEDGKFEVYTEEPINGKRVNLFTAEELDAMTGKQQEQTNQAPVQGEQGESPALVAENATTQKEDVAGMNDGTIAENATVQKEETPQHEPTALERIPTNEQGEPIYEQADPETAWDAIVEQTEGDESIAQSVADGMVADMEAAVRRAEKAKVKGGTTIAEKIAAEKERVATIEQAKATLEHWKKIASTNSRRQEAIQAEETRKAKEAALLRKEQEEKERAMREEAQPQTLDYKLSDEVDENGHPFVLTSAGELAFGNIGKETGLVPAPILLSEGVITNSKTNAGYGLVHIEARHGEQIRNAGYQSVVAFVEEVAKHYDVIREGINRSGEQTYMLQLTDRHNNTLMVELSGDGTYYNINTAGIFKTSYGKNRREVYNRHTTDNQSTESGEESQGEAQSGTTSPSRMKSSTRSSAGKVSESSNAMQGNAEKTSENEATIVETNPTEAQKEQLKSTQGKETDEHDFKAKKELEDFVASTDSNNRTKIDESKYDAEDLFAPLLLDGKSSNLAVMTLISDYIYDPIRQIAVYDYSFDIDNKTNSGWQKWGDLADEYNAHAAEVDKAWGENDNAMLEFRTVDAAVKFNDWLKAKEDGKSNVVHSFGNSASQNDTGIKLSDTSFAKMENGEQKAEREIGWLVDHNIRLEENSRKLNEIAHLLFDGDNIDSNRESTLREEAKKILEENEKLSRDYQKNYSDKYFGTDDITANYILQEANERLIALGVKPVKESYYFQSRKNEVAQNAVVQLLKRIGIPVHVISRVGAEVSGQGNSRGWTNGLDIWLTKDNINAETPVHEYTHIWTFALMKKNPKLWAEIKNLLKDSEWVDSIQSMDEYKYTLDNEDLLYSEVLSRISGERNGEKFESMAFKLIEEVNSVEKKVDLKRGLEKLRDALKRFWEWVGVNLFGMKEFKSVDDVCDRVLFDLLNASDIARTGEMREYYEEEREMNTIIDKAKEDGTYLKTPNGEDTKLPEKVWAYARTKKFKTQLSDRLNLILNESKEDFKDWEKEEFRDLFKKHDLLEENNEPGRFLVSQFMYSEKYYDRKGKMQEEAKETMNSGKGGENVSSVKSVDMRDAEYIKAVENNDTETIQRLLSEEAERKGYSNDSSYQGSLAFNGSAPYQNAYFETKEERKEAWENDEYEDTMSLGDYVDSGIDTNNLEWNLTDPMALRQADPERREAIENLRQTVRSNSKTITIYRAVDANIKENEIRNGDWVTPSRSYAEYHIGLQDWENGRIIEQEVSIDDLWWDGNDIAEWGYDNGKGEVYKNTPNNRKMFEVTYDDKGNIIPLSERFNEENDDIRYRYEEGDNDVALQVKQPIEQSKNLVALHNLSEEKLQQALELGGFPMPSIAITKANIGHTEFGNISLLFGKDSINPTDKRNKVYGGDAWTPTFPSIGYKLNSEKTSDIYRRANNVGLLPLFRPVFFHPDNYENKIDGQGSNGLVEHFKDDYGAKQMFLYEKGNAVEKFVQHAVEKYSDENVKFFEKILEIIGLEKLKNESYDSLENEMKKLLGQYYGIDFDTMKPFRVKNRINSTIQKTIDYVENGNNKIENDIAATEEKIDERIDPKEFRKWLEKLFSGVVEKKGIRNKKDMFTPSGNRREWENLYDAVTLDNAIKAMQTQAKKGGTGLFGGSIFGAASKELKEIEDIRNEAKLRINPISEEDYLAEKDRITERLEKVTIPSVSKSFSDAMNFVEDVKDAVSKSHTAKGIYRHLHSLYPDMTMEVAKEIEDIVKDIQKISTRYLEAKPYRAVSFDEIKAAVVPSDTSSELIQQLKDRGIEVSTYEKDNQEQRKQIVNEVASKEELLFRNDDGIDVVNERFNEELDNLTEENADKVTLWLGKPSDVLLSSGIENKPLKLYGNKVIKKMKKHGFALDELRDLPKAVADPIAVFDNYQREGNRTILTELRSQEKNIMVAVTLGKNGVDVDFNIVSSVFGKGSSNVVDWISKGYLAYVDKEKALNYLYFSERNISEAADNSRLSSAANIVKSFENPINNSEKKLDRKSTQGKEVTEKERQQMAERANELAETLHLDNVEIVTDASTLEGKKAKAKGFYSTSTGKITIVIPNHSNIADVEKTLLHEAVAHHGLRKLFGEHFDNFLDNVFKNASEDVRREIVKLAAKNKWDFRIATEEYLASLAEDTNFEKMPNGFWDKVKRLFTEMLRSVGLLKQKDGELHDNELRYILWRSYKNLKEKGQSNSILNKAEDIAMQHRLKVGNYAPQEEGKAKVSERPHKTEKVDNNTTLYREDEPEVTARTIYEDAVKDTGKMSMLSALAHTYSKEGRERFKHKFSESYFDYSRSIKQLQDAISKASGRKLEEFEEVWKSLNAKSSIDSEEINLAMLRYISPLSIHIAEMIRGVKMDGQQLTLDDVEVYMNALHGIERNAYMANSELKSLVNKKLEKWKEHHLKKLRDSGISKEEALSVIATEEADKRDEITQLNMGKTRKDYSGLTALFSDENTNNIDVAILEERAQKYVNAFEKAVGKDKVDEMWKKVKNLNDFSIRKAYLSGLINKKHYDEIKNMYEHYVPLRGWHDDYAGDIFEYVNAGQSMDALQGVVKKAYGRTTRAGNILGTMASMANTAIVQGNKNLVAQKFLNLALNYGNKSGLLMVSKQWYEETASGELVPLYPSLKEGMSAAEMQQRIEEFEAEMEEAKKSGTKKIYTRSFGDNMPQNFQKWQEKQHSIRALRNGVEHTIYVLGNPKAAQAFNGLLTPVSQVGAAQDIIMKVMRFQAMMQTSLSPEFVISNFQRDVLTAATGTYIKYGWGAGKDFASNLTKVMPVSGLQEGNPFGIYNLIHKYNKGTLDKTNDIERMFDEFVRKGGMTGISSITRAEEFEKQMEKSVKRIKRGKLDVPQQLWEDLADGIEFMNKGIENATRFAAYMTSRKMGKNVTDSIFDAKECSVNFNMKGSGAWGNLWMRRYILYANPALQSLRMLGTWYEASPKRFMGVFSTVLTASILTAMLGYASGGDDGDDNDWYKLNEFNRYNYISVKAGNGFAHWSLPQEMRPVWALGQIVFDWSNGRVSAPIAINSMATQLNNLSPMAFFSGGSDNDDSFWKTAVKAWTPTVAADFMDAYAWNENFLGKNITYRNDWNKEAPEWRKAGKDTPKWAVNLSRVWNKATGGADNRKSWWDSPALNPSAVYYIMSSQFGGMGTLATKLSRAFEQWQDPEQEVEARNIPFVSKFWVTVGDDYSKNRVLNEEFKSIWNEWKLTDYEIKHNESDLEKGLITDEEYANLEADKKYLANKIRYEALEDLMKDYNTLMRKRNDENDNPLLDEEILELKKEVVERAKMLDK